jgi:AraC-like DNA-binding protein
MAPALRPDEVLAPAAPVRRRSPRMAALQGVVTTVWATTVPATAQSVRVVPDAAVDLVFSNGHLVVAGPDTRAVCERLAPGGVVGFQIAPAAVRHVLGAPASACLNGRVDVAELWGAPGRALQHQLAAARDEAERAELVEAAIAYRLPGLEPDPLPGVVRRTFAQGGLLDLRRLGVGERQLRRRCVAAFGYPVATLRQIIRFQRFMEAIALDHTAELAPLAAELGYSDQSHLTHQVREFSGLTPAALRRLSVHPLGATAVAAAG